MAGNPLHTVLDHLRRLHRVADSSQRSDRELLHAFATNNDQDAFALVVSRHAPLVWGVCRRIVGHHQDAEDAFQATFLILARRAGSMRWQASVGGWLHTVAQRLAVRARKQAQQRRIQERQASQASPVDPSLRELAAVVDEELRRLPAKYREPLLLHYLEGATAETAARQLDLSRAAFYNRLTRGREMLRKSLNRQGLSLAAPLLAAALTAEAEAASHSLIQATMQVVRGTVPERVAALAAGALSVTAMMKLKVGMALGLLLGVAAGGVAMLTPGASMSPLPQTERSTEASKAEDKAIRVDRYGDPLPPGAVARLGSLRYHVPDQIKTLAFAADGKTLSVSSYAGLYVIDAASGRRIKRLPTLGRSWSPEDHLAISPDCKRLLSIGPKVGNNGKGVIHDWDLNGEGPPREYERKGAGLVAWLGWSTKGEPLMICDERKAVLLYELATGSSRRFSCKAESGNFGSSVFAYTPAGQTLALVDNSNAIHIWDTVTVRERCVLKPKDTLVRHLAFASDGRALASLNFDLPPSNRRAVQLWDAVTGRLLHTLTMEEKDTALIALSPDGKLLASAGRSGVRFWDVMAGTEKRRAQGEGLDMQSITFSGDGRTLAAVQRHTGAFHLWDVASGKLKTTPVGHGAAPYGASFSSDGRRVVSCRNVDGTIYVWDAADGKPLLCIHRFGRMARDALFSEDGRTIYSASTDEEVWISDAANGERRHVLKMEDPERPDTRQSAWSLQLSDDNKQLIALSYFYLKTNAFPPKAETLITGWDTSSYKQLFRRRFPGMDSRVVLSADARMLVAPYPPIDETARRKAVLMGRPIEQTLRLEDAATGQTLLTLPIRKDPPFPVTFSPDGRLLATNAWERKPGATTSTVQLWETATGTLVQTLPGEIHSKVAFSPDGRLLALTAASQDIVIWDLMLDRERRRFGGFDAKVTHLAFSPDGRRLVSSLDDSTLLIWNVGQREMPPSPLRAERVVKACDDLASSDAPRAFRARWLLTSAPEEAVSFLKENLHPATAADPQHLRRLLADLDSAQFAVREKAQEKLVQLGDLAEPALRKTLENNPSLEMRQRVQAILERLRGPVTQPELLQALRAVAALEDIDTSQARRILKELASGAPQSRITREAKASLERLQRHSAIKQREK